MKKKLAILLVCLAFAACASAGGSQPEKSAENYVGNFAETVTEIERPLISEGTNYGEYVFRVVIPNTYIGGNTCEEVWVEAENGEPLNDAVYRRNSIVESLLNIQIKSVTANAGTLELAAYVNKIILSDSDEFDAVCGGHWTHISLLQSKCLVNLYNIPNIDLSKKWWDQRMVEDMSYMKSKLYYICGDINYFDKYGIGIMMFNKRLFDDNGLVYPYDQVRTGKWTFAEFTKLVKDFSRDLNGDGKMDENDQWGIIENAGALIHFLPSCGEKIVTLDREGSFVFNSLNERHIKVVSTLCEVLSDKTITLFADADQLRHLKDGYEDGIYKAFRNGQVLFSPVAVLGIVKEFRDMEDDFGYLPFPKFDEIQSEYYHFVSYGWGSSYGVPITNQNLDRTGMILEVMAGYSTDLIIPALIDVSLKSKFARDLESEEMLEIIINTKSYDWGIDFNIGTLVGGGPYYSSAHNGFSTFVSSVEKLVPKVEADIDKLTNLFEEMN